MTNCVGIHSARLLAGYGVDPEHACHMLMDELQLTRDEASSVIDEAYRCLTPVAQETRALPRQTARALSG